MQSRLIDPVLRLAPAMPLELGRARFKAVTKAVRVSVQILPDQCGLSFGTVGKDSTK